ncbi:MAG: Ig-like domain-containing protein [Flexilinea sp.]|nr:Ig-like domain-containing protein [Flexilinea sp.]
MKRIIFFFAFIALCLTWIEIYANNDAHQTDFKWEDYSYEELLAVKEDFDTVFSIKEREWLIEHGDRKISFDSEEYTLYKSQNITLAPVVTRLSEDAPITTLYDWMSSDDSVARISVYGTITAVGAGEAEITCTAKDNDHIFKTVKVSVILPVAEVRLTETKANLLLSDDPKMAELQLTTVIVPEEAFYKDVTWSSSNEAVATVNEKGIITAIAPGNAVITAMSTDPYSASYPKRATANITVLQAVSSLSLDQTSLNINNGSYVTLVPTISPANASQKALSWESSDPSIVRVTNGQLYAVTGGSATITATATDGSGKSASCEVNVIQMVSSVRITTGSSLEMNMNESIRVLAEIAPITATNRNVAWSSSNEKVAVISPLGEVKIIGAGTSTITCTTVDGSKLSASTLVHVPSISTDSEKVTITSKKGGTIDVGYYGYDSSNFSVNAPVAGFFTLSKSWVPESQKFVLRISPIKAGTETIYLRDSSDTKSQKTITITIDHNAVYDKSSYPIGVHRDILRNPDSYTGKQMSIRGKVVQKMEGWFGSVTLRVATDSYYFDDVYYVTYDKGDIDINVIEDDFVTIYGICTGTETYETIFGAQVTIPSMKAEKILSGFIYQ